MKKSINLLLVFFAFSFFSCMKSFTCECTSVTRMGQMTTSATVSSTIEERNRADAQQTCEGSNASVVNGSMEVSTNCELH